jgi:Zn-finger nucleic acid-binding protein
MNCPACHQKLFRTQYAGANVHRCRNCLGHLVDQRRAKKIEKRINKDLGDLKNEIQLATDNDLMDAIRCPRCKARMKKLLPKDLGFHIDECKNCDFTWFDGGELAKVQLAFEAKAQTQELNQMRNRLESMTPAERQSHKERIDGLIDLGTPFEQAAIEATFELSWQYYWNGLW